MKRGLRDASRAARVALVVGPCLVAINHFGELLRGQWSRALAFKAFLTLLVPFLVSLHRARAAARKRERAAAPAGRNDGPYEKERP